MFLSITERQLVGVEVGYTHASSVMPVVSRSEVAFGIVTRALVPLNTSALPNLPDVVQVAPLIVPVLPLPEISATVVPAPSLKVYAATKPVCAHDRPGRNKEIKQIKKAANVAAHEGRGEPALASPCTLEHRLEPALTRRQLSLQARTAFRPSDAIGSEPTSVFDARRNKIMATSIRLNCRSTPHT